MKILTASGWDDYALLDSGDGKRLERFSKYVLVRPDPEAIWKKKQSEIWSKADAVFADEKNNPHWEHGARVPKEWPVTYKNLTFQARLSPFKHTGIFPEQSVNWEFMEQKIAERVRGSIETSPNVLNLFGYTGAASLVCAIAGARVTHVDASKPAIGWARENQRLSGLLEKPIRWIMDDAVKFVAREVRRGVKYDAIIMDPPIYGHGPNGEVWDFHRSFPELVSLCRLVLSEKPLFFLVNAYAISSSAIMLNNVLSDYLSERGGTCECGEIALEEKEGKRLLSTGIFARWSW
ncbi:MAG: hypothetical protein RLZZ455_521 [Candidatus Parcubacteria bacterium]|jgi:23S rRNA (cytosine1962-C5)-methyltransferase